MSFFLQVLWNCGKQCNGTKAKLNSQSLAGLQGSAQAVHLLSFLISDFFGNPSLCPVPVLQTPPGLQRAQIPHCLDYSPKPGGVEDGHTDLPPANQAGQGTLLCTPAVLACLGHFGAQFSCGKSRGGILGVAQHPAPLTASGIPV